MNREQQRKLRELKKAVNVLDKKLAKEYKLKKISDYIWCKKDELLFEMSSDVVENEGICRCYIDARVKPIWVDDILWDLIDMADNKNQPLSLKINGAFTVYGIEVFKLVYELPKWEIDELEECLHKGYEMFIEHIQKIDIDYYINNYNKPSYHEEIHELIMLIYNERYSEAIEYALNMKHEYFINGSLTLPMGAVEYCKKKL